MARYEVEGVHKAFAVLRVLGASDRELGASEIGRRLDLNRSSVFRLLVTLQAEGMVRQSPVTKRYRLGPDLAALGRAATDAFDLRREARPAMQSLASDTGLPVFLNVPGSSEVICLEHVSSRSTLELSGRAGYSMPFHACPSGYLLLAHGTEEQLTNVLANPLTKFASGTPTSAAELTTILEEVRATGIAYGVNDLDEGVASLAAPIHDSHGSVIASLGIAGFTVDLDPKRDTLAARLRQAADQISEHSRGAPSD